MADEKNKKVTAPVATSIFQTGEDATPPANAERRNLPQMVKHGDVPVGSSMTGELVKVIPSPVSTVKGLLLWLRLAGGVEITFPATGAIRTALAAGVEEAKLLPTLEKEVGKKLFIKRLPDKSSSEDGKKAFVFDVYMVKK